VDFKLFEEFYLK